MADQPPHRSTPGISRRTLLGLGVVGAAAVGAALAGLRLADSDDDRAEVRSRLEDEGVDVDGIDRIGAAYLSLVPEEASVPVLLDRLPDLAGFDAADARGHLDVLGDRIHVDFAEGAVVLVDGWLLAVTEARAAALISLV